MFPISLIKFDPNWILLNNIFNLIIILAPESIGWLLCHLPFIHAGYVINYGEI